MGTWADLNDFSMYEGNIPCIRCKKKSSKTLVGDHWKCSICAHVFNKDGSDIGVECYCEGCQEKHVKTDRKQAKGVKAAIKKVEAALKKLAKEQKSKKSV